VRGRRPKGSSGRDSREKAVGEIGRGGARIGAGACTLMVGLQRKEGRNAFLEMGIFATAGAELLLLAVEEPGARAVLAGLGRHEVRAARLPMEAGACHRTGEAPGAKKFRDEIDLVGCERGNHGRSI